MWVILYDCFNHTDTVVSSKNNRGELFLHPMPLMVIPSLIHYFCLFFRGMRKFIPSVLILNGLAYVIILTLPVGWRAFSSATVLLDHQLITGCKSQPFILISTLWKAEKLHFPSGTYALGSHASSKVHFSNYSRICRRTKHQIYIFILALRAS